MAESAKKEGAYVKPTVRQIKLSLAELTLGTNCDINNPANVNGGCPPIADTCNQ